MQNHNNKYTKNADVKLDLAFSLKLRKNEAKDLKKK